MGFRIFILPQVISRFTTVHGAFDTTEQQETVIPEPSYPAGCQVVYKPELDMYSRDDTDRRVLLSDPAGTATNAEIEAAFPLYLKSQMDVVRAKCNAHIHATYPDWYQRNADKGWYGPGVSAKVDADIISVIEESNRCEQLIYNWQDYTLNLPVIGGAI